VFVADAAPEGPDGPVVDALALTGADATLVLGTVGVEATIAPADGDAPVAAVGETVGSAVKVMFTVKVALHAVVLAAPPLTWASVDVPSVTLVTPSMSARR